MYVSILADLCFRYEIHARYRFNTRSTRVVTILVMRHVCHIFKCTPAATCHCLSISPLAICIFPTALPHRYLRAVVSGVQCCNSPIRTSSDGKRKFSINEFCAFHYQNCPLPFTIRMRMHLQLLHFIIHPTPTPNCPQHHKSSDASRSTRDADQIAAAVVVDVTHSRKQTHYTLARALFTRCRRG